MEPVFEIINETTKQEYKVTMDDAIVTGNIERQQGSVISINGTLFTKTAQGTQGDYIGNFNGRMTDSGMKYSFSEMNHDQAELAWDAIAVIEDAIFDNAEE